MDLTHLNPKQPKLKTTTNIGFTIQKLNTLEDKIVNKVRKDLRDLDIRLEPNQIKKAIDIYMRDMAGYLHSPTAAKLSTPMGVFKIRYPAIDSYIQRKALPNIRKEKTPNKIEGLRTLWKLRSTKYKKETAVLPIDNQSLQLSAVHSYNINFRETNPTQIILINAINKLIKDELRTNKNVKHERSSTVTTQSTETDDIGTNNS